MVQAHQPKEETARYKQVSQALPNKFLALRVAQNAPHFLFLLRDKDLTDW
jgi:hypothetical protein